MRIEKDLHRGYRIFLGDGKRGGYKAQDFNELVAAIKHHYENKELGENPNCPLCRAIHAEMKAMRNGKPWVTALPINEFLVVSNNSEVKGR